MYHIDLLSAIQGQGKTFVCLIAGVIR